MSRFYGSLCICSIDISNVTAPCGQLHCWHL